MGFVAGATDAGTLLEDGAAERVAETRARCQVAIAVAHGAVERAQVGLAVAVERLQRAQERQRENDERLAVIAQHMLSLPRRPQVAISSAGGPAENALARSSARASVMPQPATTSSSMAGSLP
jgi:hypothetical protein